MKKVVIYAVLTLFAVAGLHAQDSRKIVTSDKTDWQKIGETTVNFNTDRDEITVNGADKFAAIKFKVMDEPIYLTSLEAYFDDGNKQDINVNFPVKPQGESRVIELDGGERDLKKIVFVYKTIANRKDLEAHVEVWGLKTNDDKR
jgi:hypothetical protein